jgi:glycerate kinase
VRILVAPQEFKGTLTARQAAEAMAGALRDSLPDAELDVLPLADGGPGTVDAVAAAVPGAREVRARVEDPLGREVEARYLLLPDGRTAVLEMAEAAGLWRLSAHERDPLRASTWGVGQLLQHALAQGATRLVLGLGGSATNDGGVGAARALGVRLLPWPEGRPSLPEALPAVERVDLSLRDADVLEAELLLATDVTSPLLGPSGATRLFGPQKGAAPAGVEELEAALGHLARVVALTTAWDVSALPGAGAAGGLAFGLAALLGGRITSGFALVAAVSQLDARLRDADWVLTGEGALDAQSLLGKGPVTLAQRARQAGARCAAFVGRCEAGAEAFDAVVECPAPAPHTAAGARAALQEAVRRWAAGVPHPEPSSRG